MTPAELLAATAADMRAVADAVPESLRWRQWLAHDNWVYGPPGNGLRVGWDIREHGPAATHIAAWDPDMARAVADWLDSKAFRYADPNRAEVLDFDIKHGDGTPPMLKICEAWWKSRGREPVAL